VLPVTSYCCQIYELQKTNKYYLEFHGFGQAKFAFGGSVLGASQFTQLPQLPLKTALNLKVVKID